MPPSAPASGTASGTTAMLVRPAPRVAADDEHGGGNRSSTASCRSAMRPAVYLERRLVDAAEPPRPSSREDRRRETGCALHDQTSTLSASSMRPGVSSVMRGTTALGAAMSEPRIGRVLVASLHQAIADLLPTRLEFYENWLNVSGLRDGTIGLAPLSAVLSFLRTEGDAYSLITARAGEYAADWTINTVPPFERRLIRALPAGAAAARGACACRARLVRSTYPGSRAIVRHQARDARRSTCADRCSAKCAKRRCCRCAGSTRRRSARVLQLFAHCGRRAGARSVARPAARKGCMLSRRRHRSRPGLPPA